MAGNSVKVVFSAVGANFLIGVSKFIVASISGSAAMMAEGIHSVVDTMNGILLFMGMKRSGQGPSEKHPYGTGMELYFWSFIVSMLVFVFGAALAIYEGVHAIQYPTPHEGSYLYNYIVFGVAFALEGASLIYGFKSFRRANTGLSFVDAIKKSKDSATIAVVLEEIGAVAGIIIATIGTILVQYTRNPLIDGITSITIGALLLVVAWILAKETKRLLIGEGLGEEDLAEIRKIIESYEVIDEIREVRSMYFSLEEVILTCIVDVNDDIRIGEWESINQEIEQRLTERFKKLRFIYIEVSNGKKA